MPRRATKIVATLGPASNTPAMLEAMITAGVNVVRLNFSHGKAQDHINLAKVVRDAAAKAGHLIVCGLVATAYQVQAQLGHIVQALHGLNKLWKTFVGRASHVVFCHKTHVQAVFARAIARAMLR